MTPRISLVTLGVSDLQRSTAFYVRLGFPKSHHGGDQVSFFELAGTWLALFPREALAADATVSSDGAGFPGFTLAHNVASKEEVDRVLAHAAEVGARIVKPASEADWGGYTAYFADPDDFLWEVVWNPFMDLT